MKRTLVLILVLVCLSTCLFHSQVFAGEIDLSQYSIEELIELRKNITDMLTNLGYTEKTVIPGGKYIGGETIKPGRYIVCGEGKQGTSVDVYIYESEDAYNKEHDSKDVYWINNDAVQVIEILEGELVSIIPRGTLAYIEEEASADAFWTVSEQQENDVSEEISAESAFVEEHSSEHDGNEAAEGENAELHNASTLLIDNTIEDTFSVDEELSEIETETDSGEEERQYAKYYEEMESSVISLLEGLSNMTDEQVWDMALSDDESVADIAYNWHYAKNDLGKFQVAKETSFYESRNSVMVEVIAEYELMPNKDIHVFIK